MSFRVTGLDPAPFQHLHGLSDPALAALGARRVLVEADNSAPCRITLDDAARGESVLLLNFTHQPADTPYRQQGPIFVRESSARFEGCNVVPPAMARRTLSVRGFDADHMMIEADVIDGKEASALIERFFVNPDVAYIHAHYARRGCFAALVGRA